MYLFMCYDKYIKSNQKDLDMIETYKNLLKKMEAEQYVQRLKNKLYDKFRLIFINSFETLNNG